MLLINAVEDNDLRGGDCQNDRTMSANQPAVPQSACDKAQKKEVPKPVIALTLMPRDMDIAIRASDYDGPEER